MYRPKFVPIPTYVLRNHGVNAAIVYGYSYMYGPILKDVFTTNAARSRYMGLSLNAYERALSTLAADGLLDDRDLTPLNIPTFEPRIISKLYVPMFIMTPTDALCLIKPRAAILLGLLGNSLGVIDKLEVSIPYMQWVFRGTRSSVYKAVRILSKRELIKVAYGPRSNKSPLTITVTLTDKGWDYFKWTPRTMSCLSCMSKNTDEVIDPSMVIKGADVTGGLTPWRDT